MNNLRFYHGTGRTIFVDVTENGLPVDLSAHDEISFRIMANNKPQYVFNTGQQSITIDGSRLRVDISRAQVNTLYGKSCKLDCLLTTGESHKTYTVGTLVSDGFATRSEGKKKLETSITLDINP